MLHRTTSNFLRPINLIRTSPIALWHANALHADLSTLAAVARADVNTCDCASSGCSVPRHVPMQGRPDGRVYQQSFRPGHVLAPQKHLRSANHVVVRSSYSTIVSCARRRYSEASRSGPIEASDSPIVMIGSRARTRFRQGHGTIDARTWSAMY